MPRFCGPFPEYDDVRQQIRRQFKDLQSRTVQMFVRVVQRNQTISRARRSAYWACGKKQRRCLGLFRLLECSSVIHQVGRDDEGKKHALFPGGVDRQREGIDR
jgi:hypothetical protein